MTPFWNWFITLWPMWVAPNLITLLGLVVNGAAVMAMLSMDSTFTVELPTWIIIAGAASLFFYQTLDAVDGK